MKAIVFDTREEAEKYAAAIDELAGYPRDGIDVGGGRHAPPELSRTERAAELVEHPDEKDVRVAVVLIDEDFALCDGKATDIDGERIEVKSADAEALDASWDAKGEAARA